MDAPPARSTGCTAGRAGRPRPAGRTGPCGPGSVGPYGVTSGRPEGGRDVHRPGVVGDHQARPLQHRHQLAAATSARPRGRRPAARPPASGPPATHARQPEPLPQRPDQLGEVLGRPPLGRPVRRRQQRRERPDAADQRGRRPPGRRRRSGRRTRPARGPGRGTRHTSRYRSTACRSRPATGRDVAVEGPPELPVERRPDPRRPPRSRGRASRCGTAPGGRPPGRTGGRAAPGGTRPAPPPPSGSARRGRTACGRTGSPRPAAGARRAAPRTPASPATTDVRRRPPPADQVQHRQAVDDVADRAGLDDQHPPRGRRRTSAGGCPGTREAQQSRSHTGVPAGQPQAD